MNPENESKKNSILKRFWGGLRSWCSKTWKRSEPSPPIRKSASWAILIVIFLFALLSGPFIKPGLPSLLDPLFGVLFYLFVGALMWLIVFLGIKFLSLFPRFVNLTGLISLIVLIFVLKEMSLPLPTAIMIGLIFGLAAAFFGGGIAALTNREFRFARPLKKIFIFCTLIIPLVIYGYAAMWLLSKGNTDHLVEFHPNSEKIQSLTAPNPSRPGAFEVKTMTYGSGTDKRRPEFGKDAHLITESVDATPFVKGNKGLKMKIRKWYWGFDIEEFPVNGRVWFPAGDGPFPLVLCVHGNHKMQEHSDPGYAYLGEHLASRGFIFVSVDENFFNGSFMSSLRTENDGRGWMLLQHFKVWRTWNGAEDNPFYGKVDMDNLGIIGHSRGGEAAGIAGDFNRLAYYPDDATVEFDFNFNIKAIIAIAPSDQQYRPAGQPNPLENVNYLTLQGAHDADVSVFMGARQYERVKFTDGRDWFKASIYTYRSNHGQFNTIWGDSDFGMPLSLFLNKKALLNGEEQRTLGKVYMTAFLEAALMEKQEYIPLFRDYRTILDWLPEDIFINRYEDSSFQVVCDFEEDVDVTSGTAAGVDISGINLALWKEADLGFRRGGTKQNNVVVLGWEDPAEIETGEKATSYSIGLPPGMTADMSVDGSTNLVFSLCEADESIPDDDDSEDENNDDWEDEGNNSEGDDRDDKDEKNSEEKKSKEPLELTIELEDAEGNTARLPLSAFRKITPIIKSKFMKMKDEASLYGNAYEPTLQLFELPLKVFTEQEPLFDPAALRTIRLVFDLGREGVIILDRVGFAR
ncbi:hypothetical protein ACFLT9_07985 [Acidobacteriota bacterium]